MKICIYGAGNFGSYLAEKIKINQNIEVLGFIDNDNSKKGGVYFFNLPIFSLNYFRDELSEICDGVILAAVNNATTQEMVLSLIDWYEKDIFIADKMILTGQLELFEIDDKTFKPYIRNYLDTQPELDYVEFDVTDYCNLKCKNCGHFSNEVKKMTVADYDLFENSILGLKDRFSNIKKVRLMGGEPLLVNYLYKYISCVRKYFPGSEICVVTNGLLIPEMNVDNKKSIITNNVVIQISQYPPTRERIGDIIKFLLENNIRFEIGQPITEFFELQEEMKPSGFSADINWRNCLNQTCHSLKNGRLAPCAAIFLLKKLCGDATDEIIKKYSIDIINGNESGWDILNFIEKPFDYCKKCSIEKKKVKWERMN